MEKAIAKAVIENTDELVRLITLNLKKPSKYNVPFLADDMSDEVSPIPLDNAEEIECEIVLLQAQNKHIDFDQLVKNTKQQPRKVAKYVNECY